MGVRSFTPWSVGRLGIAIVCAARLRSRKPIGKQTNEVVAVVVAVRVVRDGNLSSILFIYINQVSPIVPAYTVLCFEFGAHPVRL